MAESAAGESAAGRSTRSVRSTQAAVTRRSLSDSAYDAILSMLMNRELEPDDSLSIDGMARILGVSPTPVREALARLEAPGLVRRTALKGYRVAPILNAQELADLMEARLVLEPVLTRRACARSTPAFIERLAEVMRTQQGAGRGPGFESFQQFLRADEAFHAAIADQAGNQFLLSAYDALGGHVQRFRLFAGQGVIDAEQAMTEHQAVFEALAAGDGQLAEALMRTHLLKVAARAAAELRDIVSA